MKKKKTNLRSLDISSRKKKTNFFLCRKHKYKEIGNKNCEELFLSIFFFVYSEISESNRCNFSCGLSGLKFTDFTFQKFGKFGVGVNKGERRKEESK